MKKLYIFIAALFFSFSLHAQIINIPDAYFKNALVNSNSVDTDGDGTGDSVADLNTDGEIQVSEAELVTSLIIRYDNIDSLQGIEAFTNLQVLNVTGNNLVTLNLSSLTNLINLNCSYNDFTTLDIGSPPNLITLNCSGNELTSIDVSAFTNLQSLNVTSNNLAVLDISSLTNLIDLNCGSNNFTTLDFDSVPSLTSLNCRANNLTSLNVSELTNLTSLRCDYTTLSSLDLSALTNLQNLDCSNNQFTVLDVSALANLQGLNCNYNQLTTLDVNTLINLQELNCRGNQITALDISDLTNLNFLDCSENQLTALEVVTNTNLTYLSCSNNELTALDVSTLSNLRSISCGRNQLTELDVSLLTDIIGLRCDSNQITELDVSTLTNLSTFNCGDNLLTELDITNNPLLSAFYCYENQITFLDLSNKSVNTYEYDIGGNLIETLILKNGNAYDVDPNDPDFVFDYFNISNNPLTYVCADEFELELVNNLLDSSGISNCIVNTYCSFVPGGEYYTIEGNTRIDLDSNGCDSSDSVFPNLNLTITDGTETGSFIANSSGNYNIPVQEGSHTITPTLENPDYFSVSPTSITVDFPSDTSPHVQDFCVTANSTYNDLEIALLPLEGARPGFDTNYKLIYKNKGTTILSGSVDLSFQDDIMDFVSANPTQDAQTSGMLSWNFSDLTPFEIREITFTMGLNAPTDTPPINGDDILVYEATINHSQTDETPDDNTAIFNQTVVNSFDPNDKTCLEGDYITQEKVGEYVHYNIRFENTGTASAVNIVIKDDIDITKYDLSSLIPLHASHDYVARIKDQGNEHYIEFIFKDINLPFDDANNDGYIAFKIKTLDTLVLGDSFDNNAEIYFDYNFPIITNDAITTIATLSTEDFEVANNNILLYPNPTTNLLHLETKQSIEQIFVYDVSGRLLKNITVNGSKKKIDISALNLTSGSYFVKIKTEIGETIKKVIKN